MYLIVGLGNPEEEYARTRHNMGFDTINKIAEKHNIKVNKSKFNSLYGTGSINNEKIVILKPQTYMNLSGKAVRDFMNFYKIKENELIVIYDDLDIEPGIIKIRKKGGPGTHNGMKSVVNEIQTENFIRVRVGIGNPKYKDDLLNYILTRIPDEEYKILASSTSNAAEAVTEIIATGIDKAMNKYN